MTLRNLKRLIDYAIDDCQWIILQNPKAILSEGDFERLLSDCISKRIGYMAVNPDPNEYAVYSQISHYDNEENVLDARVDLLLMIPAKIKESLDHYKRFVYKSKKSIAIELKYRHDDKKADIDAAKEDIKKYVKYKDDSYYYAIILLDKKDNTIKCEEDIFTFYEEQKNEYGNDCINKFFCKVLYKEIEKE
jgi:hypothetical protein